MEESTKKIVIIIVAVVAVIGAVFGAMKFASGDKVTVDNTVKMPAGFKNEKEQALSGQKGGVERDLSK